MILFLDSIKIFKKKKKEIFIKCSVLQILKGYGYGV